MHVLELFVSPKSDVFRTRVKNRLPFVANRVAVQKLLEIACSASLCDEFSASFPLMTFFNSYSPMHSSRYEAAHGRVVSNLDTCRLHVRLPKSIRIGQ
jgi:hypothetical protein